MSDRVYVRTGQVQEALDRIDERAKHTMQQCDIMAYSVHNLRSRMQTDMSDFVNRETKIAEEQIFRLLRSNIPEEQMRHSPLAIHGTIWKLGKWRGM